MGAADFTGSSFLSNTAGSVGGAAYASMPSITWTTFLSNTALQQGGALYLDGSSSTPASVVNSLFARNRSLSNQGDALYMRGFNPASNLTLLHNTLANPTPEDGAAIYVYTGTVAITNTIIASHTIAIERVGGTVVEDYNLFDTINTPFSGTVGAGTHSITGTAAFVDGANDDYHLTEASEAIDRGVDAGIVTDLEGSARPQGNGPDRGAFESPYTFPLLLTISDGSMLTEGNSGSSTMPFTVTLSSQWMTTVTVAYATSDGSAMAGGDYVATSGVLTLVPGETSQQIPVTVNGDSWVESDETFNLSLSNASGATIDGANGVGTIINDDSTALSIADSTVTEGDSGVVNALFPVTLSYPSELTVTVQYTTSEGSANDGVDYTGVLNATLTFTPGVISQTIAIAVLGDVELEANETFSVTLGSAQYATIDDGMAIGSILDNDTPTATPTSTVMPTLTLTPTLTQTPVPTATDVSTPTSTVTPTLTLTPTLTQTPVPTATDVSTPTGTAMPTATVVSTPTNIATATPMLTLTPTPESQESKIYLPIVLR